jgi:adenylate kinase
VPTDVVLERIAKRKHVEGRGDDHASAIRRRLELYEEQTAPLIDFYRQLDRLVDVDGMGEPDDVFKRLVAAIDERVP